MIARYKARDQYATGNVLGIYGRRFRLAVWLLSSSTIVYNNNILIYISP